MGAYNFYPQTVSFDIRDNFHTMLFGDYLDPGIGRPLRIRRIRNQKCICFNDQSGSPLPGCRYCDGEGYLWTETINVGYIGKNLGSVLSGATAIPNQNQTAAWGTSDEQRALAYFEYNVFPNYERYLRPDQPTCDKLYELKIDDEGGLITPVILVAKWKMRSVTPHHGDGGRVEFFEVGLEAESV